MEEKCYHFRSLGLIAKTDNKDAIDNEKWCDKHEISVESSWKSAWIAGRATVIFVVFNGFKMTPMR